MISTFFQVVKIYTVGLKDFGWIKRNVKLKLSNI